MSGFLAEDRLLLAARVALIYLDYGSPNRPDQTHDVDRPPGLPQRLCGNLGVPGSVLEARALLGVPVDPSMRPERLLISAL